MIGAEDIATALRNHEELSSAAYDAFGGEAGMDSYVNNLGVAVDGLQQAATKYGLTRTSIVAARFALGDPEIPEEERVANVCAAFSPSNVIAMLGATFAEALVVGLVLGRENPI